MQYNRRYKKSFLKEKQATKKLIDSVWITQAYAYAITYSDYSVLETSEETEVMAFANQYPLNGFILDVTQKTEMTTCHISGLLSDCVLINIICMK